jgi:hypothetical protein
MLLMRAMQINIISRISSEVKANLRYQCNIIHNKMVTIMWVYFQLIYLM